jgi:putative redox protein
LDDIRGRVIVPDVAGFDVEISLADAAEDGVDPARLTVAHHLTERAEVRSQVLSGGHLLHLAVAGCLFNDILREAKARGIAVTDLRISADGGFEGDPPLSTGITYSIDIAGDAPEDELREIVEHREAIAAIPLTLRRGAEVESGVVTARTTAR